jgi:hypothetical protein
VPDAVVTGGTLVVALSPPCPPVARR